MRASNPATSLARRLHHRLIVPPDPFRFDPRLDRLVNALCQAAPPDRPVLNLGSGHTRLGPRVINLDLFPSAGVNVQADAHALPFPNHVFSGVLLRGVLEHVRNAEVTRSEIDRVLGPLGFLYVEVPFLQPFHASPADYRRFTLPGLHEFFEGFTPVESGVQIGPASSLAWVARETLASLLSFGSPRLYPKVLTVAAWGTFWLKYLDALVEPAPWVSHAASALYFLGKKRG